MKTSSPATANPEQASTSVAPVANRERIAIGAAELWRIQQQIAMEIAVGCETDFPLSQRPEADQWKE
jgi:hypothetical protein